MIEWGGRGEDASPPARMYGTPHCPMDLPLFLLHLRRALHPALGLVLAGVALVVLAGAPHGAREVLRAGIDSEALTRGLRRADMLFALLCLLGPALLLTVARALRRVDDGERLWLLSRPIARHRIALSIWGGALAGALVWLSLVGIAVELRAGGGASSSQPAAELELGTPSRDGEGVLYWSSETGRRPAGCAARLSMGLFGSYNEIEAFELAVHEGAAAADYPAVFPTSAPDATGIAEPNRRTAVEVELPAGEGALLFSLRARGAVRSVQLERPLLELYLPADERAGTLGLLLEVALILAGTLALALGLGAWLSQASCLLGILGGYVLVWLETDALDGTWVSRWLPGYDLPGALALVAEGRVPRSLPPQAWLGALVMVLVGLLLQRAALGRWRSGP
jgi:hypothetical protein